MANTTERYCCSKYWSIYAAMERRSKIDKDGVNFIFT